MMLVACKAFMTLASNYCTEWRPGLLLLWPPRAWNLVDQPCPASGSLFKPDFRWKGRRWGRGRGMTSEADTLSVVVVFHYREERT